jgi:hypothetical protein
MAVFTERVRFTVPVETKAKWKAQADAKGLSLSAFLRDMIDDLLAAEELSDLVIELEAKRLESAAS